ncbi:YybH family protein [Chitinophaga sp.]|uniref:YybH family protein n=1 Tax=Chitinophaga sp. TaxID=1869181 RepID=UPI002F936AE8
MKLKLPVLLFIMVVCSFNGIAQSQQLSNLEDAKKAIAQANAIHFSLFAKNDGSILNLYTEDACLLMPGAPAFCGHDGLAKFFNDVYAAGSRNGKITTLDVYGDGGDFVTEVGLTQVFDGNGKMLGEGKYIVVWKKTKDGWKMFRDMYNSSQPN